MKTNARAVLVWAVVCAVLFAAPLLRALWVPGGSPLCTAPNNQDLPYMVPDGSGGAIIAWTDVRDLDFDIYAQRVNDRGAPQWTADGVPVCTIPEVQSYPQVIPDGSGGAIMAWNDIRDGAGDFDIYAQRINADGAVMWPDTGVLVCDTITRSEVQDIASDGSGGAYVVWVDDRGDQNEVYVQRIDPNGNTLWRRNGVAITRAPDYETSPAIISDGAGGAIVAWQDGRAGIDMYVQRIDANGDIMWTAGGVPISTAPLEQRYFDMTTDGAGGAIIAWEDSRHTGVKQYVYAQRVDADGNALWTANGDSICTTPYSQRLPKVVSDGAGGAIVVWEDRQGSISNIHAQRLGPNGAWLWTNNGVLVCSASGNQSAVRAVPDGSGGVIAAWEDTRNGSTSDIYARRIDANGVVMWTADGIAVCTAFQDQEYVTLTTTGSGETIFAWEDARNGNWDIYGALADAAGQLVPTVLKNYQANVRDGAVLVRWTVSTTPPGGEPRFTVYRRELSGERPWARLEVEIAGGDGAYSFIDATVQPGSSYRYRVDAIDETGAQTLMETEALTVPAPAMTLYQNAPNPFTLSTAIRYYLPRESAVTLSVYDNAGRLVNRLLDGEVKEAGLHVLDWNGRDFNGEPIASGVYFCRLQSGKFSASRKMVLLR
jgi:hypothetical protein